MTMRLMGHVAGPTIRSDQVAGAWVNFIGTSGVINANHNVSSVTRNAAADYTITFSRAFAGASTYAIAGAGELRAAFPQQSLYMTIKPTTNPTSTSVTVICGNSNGSSTDPTNGIIVAVGKY